MTHHDKGLRLADKAIAIGANTPKGRRLVRRVLRVWAIYHDSRDSKELAAQMRKKARELS